MSAAGTGVFLAAGLLALLGALGTIVVKSPIRAAMCLLVHIVALSALFLSLHAHMLAALQIVVYAGAVVVLFVFVIMLMGPGVPDTPTTRGLVLKAVSATIMGILTFAVASVVVTATPERPIIEQCAPGQGAECGQFGGVSGFAKELFERGVVPFELISVLLTVAIVGAIAVARSRSASEARAQEKRRAELAARDAATVPAEAAAQAGH